MRLILTSLQEFRDGDANLRLLGPWCLQKDAQPIDFERLVVFKDPVRPFPSTTPEAAQEITEALNTVLPILAESLNSYHGRNYSFRFWQILLQHSLVGLTVLLYDRFIRVKTLLAAGESFETEIFPASAPLEVPPYFAALTWGEQTAFNHFVYSEILRFLKAPRVQLKELPWAGPVKIIFHDNSYNFGTARLTLRQRLGRFRRRLMAFVEAHYRDRGFKRGVNIKGVPHMEPKDFRRLVRSLESIKTPKSKPIVQEKIQISEGSQKLVIKLNSEKEFLQFLEGILPRLLPTIMTTGFKDWEAKGLSQVDPRVKICVWGPNFADKWDERMELALYKEFNQAICIGTQHGTGYGTFRYCPDPFQTEYKMFDEFITWGWSSQDSYPLVADPLPQPMFAKIENSHQKRTDDIVYVGTLATGTVYYSLPLAHSEECYKYFVAKERFLGSLDGARFKEILYRAYFAGALFINELKFMKDRFPQTRLLYGALWPALQTCRLAVLDHPGSTLHVVASMNTPFIVFYDPVLWPMCKEMDPFVQQFKEAGMWFETPEEAARHVNKVGADVQSWWNQPQVRKAREDFVKYHALTDAEWPNRWAHFLKEKLRNI